MRSVEYTALIGGDHVLDVDEGVLTAVNLEHLQSGLDEIAQVLSLPLAVVDLVAEVVVADLEQVQHGQDLSVVGDEGLTNGVRAADERL